MSRLFISHSSVNDAEAVAIRDWLRENGWDDVFLDLDPTRGIAAGERWENALNCAARRCEAVIFLVSRAWLASRWCEHELNLANKLNKRLFGVLIEDLTVSEIPPRIAATWQLVRLASGRDHIPFDVTLPVSGDLKHVYFSAEGLARLKAGLKKAGLDTRFFEWPPESEPDRAPYRGLKPVEAEDAGIFFGRDAEIIEALDRLRGLNENPPPRLLVILGASGAGKSSFLRAGLWPRLKRDDRNFFPLGVIRPERAALSGDTGLVRSLDDAFRSIGAPRTRADIRKAVNGGAEALASLLAELARDATPPALDAETPKAPTLVFSIDQGEELFLTEGAGEAEAFLNLLRHILMASSPACLAVFTIRSDAYERLQTVAALESVPQHALSLPPLAKGSYADVIEGPARRLADSPRSLTIEPALCKALLYDIDSAGGKDALPLLALTLERLYLDFGASGKLTLAHYEALGRVKGSIQAAVDRALKAAEANPAVPQDRNAKLALLRRGLIPWLAGIDSDTGFPRRRVALRREIPAEALPLIDLLVEARLLSTDTNQAGEITIEPSHEALLRQWADLQRWLKEDLSALTTLEGVKRASSDWAANGKSAAWLSHRGGRLAEAERQAAREAFANFLAGGDRAYLAACRALENAAVEAERTAARRDRMRSRVITFGSLASALVLFAIATYAFWEWSEARTQRDAALLSQSQFLTREAKRAKEGGDVPTSLLLALAALPDPASTDTALRNRPYWSDAEAALWIARQRWRPFRVLGHDGIVWNASFSPDGSRVVTASLDRTARLWDARSGQPLGEPMRHEAGVNSASFSPDGRRILTASEDKTARLWDAQNGKPLGEPMRHDGPLWSAAFSPDGSRIITASEDSTARLWDAQTGQALGEPMRHEDRVLSAAFSRDGHRIVTGSEDKSARLWDAGSGKPLGEPMRHEDSVRSVAFSPDGSRIVTASNNAARLWDAQSGQPIGEAMGHEGTVWDAAFSPDGRHIVTASEDKTARLWDGFSGRQLGAPMRHEKGIVSAAFSPDGRLVATVSGDSTARLWDAESGKPAGEPMHHDGPVISAAFSADARRIVTTSWDSTARLWDVQIHGPPGEAMRHEDKIMSAAFSPDGRRILTASDDSTARLWDVESGKPLGQPMRHEKNVRSAAFSPDGRRIVTASWDNTARLWDAESGEQLGEPMHHSAQVGNAAFSPDGRRIVTASWNGTAQLWDVESFRPLGEPMRHEALVLGVAFSPDGRRVATASADNNARVWDVESCKQLGIPMHHEKAVLSVAFSPDGRRIVTASWDSTARVWDTDSGKPIGEPMRHEDTVYTAVFSPDGSRIVTASEDKTARLWNAENGQPLGEPMRHEEGVRSAVFSPDGLRIVTASGDAARVWKVFPAMDQALVNEAKAMTPICLRRQLRDQYYLPSEPPDWCITGWGGSLDSETNPANWRPKWPYHSDRWKKWLIAKRAGQALPLPSD